MPQKNHRCHAADGQDFVRQLTRIKVDTRISAQGCEEGCRDQETKSSRHEQSAAHFADGCVEILLLTSETACKEAESHAQEKVGQNRT